VARPVISASDDSRAPAVDHDEVMSAKRFQSILSPGPPPPEPPLDADHARMLRDLHLDEIIDGITTDWREYDLAAFFLAAPVDLETVIYRQEVMEEVAGSLVSDGLAEFCGQMRTMRRSLASAAQTRHHHERTRWLLGAADAYCRAIRAANEALHATELRSRGLVTFRRYLAELASAPAHRALAADVAAQLAALAKVRYALLIADGAVTVRPYRDEADYSVVVEALFARFRQGEERHDANRPTNDGALNHVEAQILDRVARLHPAVFASLDRFCTTHAQYVDAGIVRFDREIQFYRAYLRFVAPMQSAGLAFCRPRLSTSPGELLVRGGFDLVLAARRVRERGAVVTNDFALHSPERVFVVTGPNQGGKTTFARMVGQLHFLAALGCPVPGEEASLSLYDRLFVHFAREEEGGGGRGRLQGELIRMRDTLDRATSRSIVIMNELFSSTTARDALYLTTRILERVSALEMVAVLVTFLEELSTLNERTVSMVAAVDPEDPARRTFRIERRPADGMAYAVALAEKHRVTASWIERRIAS
jgi:hypothetical protein